MIHVRELPPLRLHVEALTPKGNRYRWGSDEPDPANIPTGLSFSSTMPGGYEQLDVTLARKAGVDYSDLARLSTLRVRGAGGAIAWEGRLERTPRVSGDQLAISPSAVGWQAHLDDDKSAREVYVDRDISKWQAMSRARQVSVIGFGTIAGADSQVQQDTTTGLPSLETAIVGPWGSAVTTEMWYDAGVGNGVGTLYAEWTRNPLLDNTDANWSWFAFLSSDDIATSTNSSANLRAAGPAAVTVTATGTKRFAALQLNYAIAAAVADGNRYALNWVNVRVIGDHGLTVRGADSDAGLYASDVVTHAVGRWAPLLTIDGTVQASSFVIPHLTFPDATTAGDIVRQATSFGLQDWAVWDNRTFYWAQRGTYGRRWRARIAPAQLSETGPQLDRLWESVIVSYNDVDGTTRTVGPPGSGADTEDAVLHDTDPENPANQLGIIRRDLLSMGTSTAAGATEVGRRFLEEQKLLDTSGQAQLVGHVMDDRGVLHPYWRVRAGDTISFVDAADTSERRIVRASNDHDSRTCTVDLDAPPEGLDALLARLGVVLVPLGVSS